MVETAISSCGGMANWEHCNNMAGNTVQDDHILKRRETVSRLRLRGLTFREIVLALARDENFLNPETGKPYSIKTVHCDVKWAEAQWREHAVQAIDEHKARILSEIAEVKRQGWVQKDLSLLVKALARECDVIGLNAPIKVGGDPNNPAPVKMEVVFVEPGTECKPAPEDADAP